MAGDAHQRGACQKHPRGQRNNAPLQRHALSRADQRADQTRSRVQVEGHEEIVWRLSRKENGERMSDKPVRSPYYFGLIWAPISLLERFEHSMELVMRHMDCLRS